VADPISWVMIAGTGVAAAGALAQGEAQASAARYNATLLDRQTIATNAQVANQVARQKQEAAMVQGSLLAGYGASGVSTDEGSPMDVLRMSIANATLDEHLIRYRGELQAMGYGESATLDRQRAKTAESQAGFSAASSLSVGAGSSNKNRTISKSKGDDLKPSSAYQDAVDAQDRARKQYGIK